MRILLILVPVIAGGLLALPRMAMAQARSAAGAPQDFVRHVRRGLDDLAVLVPLQPLLHDLHMQEP